jgi:hypothetical protein
MPFEVVHPKDFPSKFGLARVPTKVTLRTWRREHGFPASVEIPRGQYRLDKVRAWFASREKRSA